MRLEPRFRGVNEDGAVLRHDLSTPYRPVSDRLLWTEWERIFGRSGGLRPVGCLRLLAEG